MGLPSSFSQLPCDSRSSLLSLSCCCSTQWNKIEHRLFSFITQNWRAKPLVSYRVIVDLIAATTTRTGLKVLCDLDDKSYPKGIFVSDEEMESLNIKRTDFHGEWNYTIAPSNQIVHTENDLNFIRANSRNSFSLDLRSAARKPSFSILVAISGSVSWALTRLCNCSMARPPRPSNALSISSAMSATVSFVIITYHS